MVCAERKQPRAHPDDDHHHCCTVLRVLAVRIHGADEPTDGAPLEQQDCHHHAAWVDVGARPENSRQPLPVTCNSLALTGITGCGRSSILRNFSWMLLGCSGSLCRRTGRLNFYPSPFYVPPSSMNCWVLHFKGSHTTILFIFSFTYFIKCSWHSCEHTDPGKKRHATCK